jgi:hypothetical protein
MNYSGAQLRFRVSSILRTGVQYKIITKSTQFKYRTRVFYDFEHKCVGRYPVKGRERNRIEREAGARKARVRLRSTYAVSRRAIKHKMRAPPLIIHALCTHTRMQTLRFFNTLGDAANILCVLCVLTLRRECGTESSSRLRR